MTRTSVEEALAALRAGRMIVVVDDEDRENEGDLVMAAEHVTPEAVNFMARHARGLICVAMPPERADALDLPLMVPPTDNTALHGTAFTVSVDARVGVSTGISAHDRAHTIRLLAAPDTRPEDLARPGHIFPLRAHPQGVLARPGHTEAAVDLLRLAGLTPVGVICEILADDGRMARWPQLVAFARRHNLPVVRIADIVQTLQEQRKRLVVPAEVSVAVG